MNSTNPIDDVLARAFDQIWPKEQKATNPEKLLSVAEKLAAEVSDPRAKEAVAKTKSELRQAERIVEDMRNNPPELLLRDMPENILDGKLGEICHRRMSRFPIAYAWPAILAVASALIGERAEGVRTNLYVALVGGVGSGKSQAIDFAIKTLGLEKPGLMDVFAGSGEGLIRETAEAAGNSRLFSPDELGHTLEKLQIERSSLSFLLSTAFYKTDFSVRMAKQSRVQFNCILSVLGGLVEDRFSDLFNAATTGGLHDRFVFGLCPDGFRLEYRPFEGLPEVIRPVAVKIHPDVWLCKSVWEKESQISPRVSENAIRAATICAAFDGKSLLTVNDLKPHHAFAEYQARIRTILKPNPGENFEAQLAHKFLDFLKRNRGAIVTRRQLFHATRAYDKGPSTADRALGMLIANGDVVEASLGKAKALRLAFEAEEIGAEAVD
jgi:hypothetical protein